MNTTDPIADYLTRLRNAIRARHKRVDIPASNFKRAITKILSDHKFINGYTEVQDTKQGVLRISLRYVDGQSSLMGVKRLSKPGLRVYVSHDKLARVLNGMGIAIVSTSKGIVTDKQARAMKIGGEVICHVW